MTDPKVKGERERKGRGRRGEERGRRDKGRERGRKGKREREMEGERKERGRRGQSYMEVTTYHRSGGGWRESYNDWLV